MNIHLGEIKRKMTIKSSSLDALQWYEGMLLTPQLLQQSDLYQQSIRNFILQYAFPYYYGILSLKIDDAKLTSGLFQITDMQAIFQDGLLYATSSEDATDLSIDLTPYKDALSKEPQLISVGVPSYVPMASNVTGDYPRFVSEAGSQAVDINTGEDIVDFPRLRGNVVIIVGDVPSRYSSIPIAKVYMNQDTYVLTNDFLPAFVSLSQEEDIAILTKSIIAKMRSKINFLYQKQNAYQNSYNAASSENENLTSILQYLSSSLLQLEALYYAGSIQPFELYKALCNLAGNLAPLKSDEALPFFGEYKHLQQYDTFIKPINFINNMLALLQKSYEDIVFNQKGRFFTLSLEKTWIPDSYFYIGVKLSTAVSSTDSLSWLDEAVIATEDHVKTVRDNRTLGTARKVLQSTADSSLTVPKGITLLQVDNDPQYITPGKTLTIFNISDLDENRPQAIIFYLQEKIANQQTNDDSTAAQTSNKTSNQPPSNTENQENDQNKNSNQTSENTQQDINSQEQEKKTTDQSSSQ